MCGLLFISKKDGKCVDRMIAKHYHSQKSRGTEGFGFIALDKSRKISAWKQSTAEALIMKELNKEWSGTILFHHRMPTSTPNVVEATHPIKVSHESLEHDYYLIHNGIIHNCDAMREKHVKMGLHYTTEMVTLIRTQKQEYVNDIEFNDSESLAIEMALVLDGKQEKLECRGSIAFICYQVDKATQKVKYVFFGRNYSNPLIMSHTENYLMLSSVGAGVSLETDTLYTYNFDTDIVTKKDMDINGYKYTGFQKKHDEVVYGDREEWEEGYWGRNREFTKKLQPDLELPQPRTKTIRTSDAERSFMEPKYTPVKRLIQESEDISDIYARLEFGKEMLEKCKEKNSEGGINYWNTELAACNEAILFYQEIDEKLQLDVALLADGHDMNPGELDADGYPRNLPRD